MGKAYCVFFFSFHINITWFDMDLGLVSSFLATLAPGGGWRSFIVNEGLCLQEVDLPTLNGMHSIA